MKIEDLEEALNSRIIAAYSLGYSVVEITRALKKTSVEFVHSLLRDTGHIAPMARHEYRRQYDIDPRIVTALRKKGFSFGRWCLGWKMDPCAAAGDLKSTPPNTDATAAHAALQRDFPEVFFSIYGGRKSRKTRRVNPSQPASLRIDWHVERRTFIATVPECPGIEAEGNDWDGAFYALKSAYRLHGYIMRLDQLVANPANNGMHH